MTALSTLAIGPSAYSLTEVPVPPDSITWGLQDVSAPDAGRVQDAANTMYKMRTSQKRKLSLSWTDPTLAQASAILQAVDPEYFFVRYIDVKSGGYEVREFYVGDRSAPFMEIRNPVPGTVVTTLSFDIIER